jgi:segregation and condensation protein B
LPPFNEQPEVNMEIKRIVEAILFAASRPMTAKQVQQVFPEIEQPELPEIQSAIDAIVEEYRFRPVELKKVASGYRFQVKQELSRWVGRLFEEKPPKYSRALLETLAIIAYRQPITRAEVEQVRGVAIDGVLQTLLERGLVEQVGVAEVIGRPKTYGTTSAFLEYFGLRALEDLPSADELRRIPVTKPEALVTVDPGLATAPPDQLQQQELPQDAGTAATPETNTPAAEEPAPRQEPS